MQIWFSCPCFIIKFQYHLILRRKVFSEILAFFELWKWGKKVEKFFALELDKIEILLHNMGIKITFAFHKKIELFCKFLTLFSKGGICWATSHIFPITYGMYTAWGFQKVRSHCLAFLSPSSSPSSLGRHTCQNFPIVTWCVNPAIHFDKTIPNLLNKVKILLNNSIFLWNANLIVMPIFHNKISIPFSFETKIFSRYFGVSAMKLERGSKNFLPQN